MQDSLLRQLLELAEVAANPRWGYRFVEEKRSLYLRRNLEPAALGLARHLVSWIERDLSLDEIRAEVNALIAAAQARQPIVADASTAAHRKAKNRAENTARLLASLRPSA